jgi:hypothetical protein
MRFVDDNSAGTVFILKRYFFGLFAEKNGTVGLSNPRLYLPRLRRQRDAMQG